MKRGIALLLVLSLLLSLTGCQMVEEALGSLRSLLGQEEPRETEVPTEERDEWQEAYEAGVKNLESERLEDALDSFTRAIEINPAKSLAYLGRAKTYVRLAETVDVSGYHVVKNGEAQPDAWLQVNEYLSRAISDCEKAVELATPEELPEIEKEQTEIQEVVEELAPALDETLMEEVKAQTGPVVIMLEYAAIIDALEDAGFSDAKWDVADCDGDGNPELFIDSYGSHDTRNIYPMLADADAGYFYTMLGSGSTEQRFYGIEGEAGWLLYNYLGTETYVYQWDGVRWNTYGGGNYTVDNAFFWKDQKNLNLEAFETLCYGAMITAEFTDPDLASHGLGDSLNAVAAGLDEALTGRAGYLCTVRADLDGDGAVEVVYLLENMAKKWFDSLQAVNEYGEVTEASFGLTDGISAVVVCSLDGQTGIRIACLEGATAGEVSINPEDGSLVLDGTAYTYQAEGDAFVKGADKDLERYTEIIDQYKAAISMDFAYDGSYYNDNLAWLAPMFDPECHVYYSLHDINGDGVKELFIGAGTDAGSVTYFDVFTHDGTNPVYYFDGDIFGYRVNLIVYTDHTMSVMGHGGYDTYYITYYAPVPDSLWPVVTEVYGMDGGVPYHYIDDSGTEVTTTADEVNEKINTLYDNALTLAWIEIES